MEKYRFCGNSNRYFTAGKVYPVLDYIEGGLVVADNDNKDHYISADYLPNFEKVNADPLEKFAAEALDCKVAIFVPGTVNVNNAADNAAHVHAAAVLLSSLFGGASSSPVTGYWVSYGDQKLVQENTTVVYANCKKADLEIYIDEIVTYCLQLCKELSQDCIALEVNGTLYFVK